MQWGDREEQQPRYICAGCGERYVEKNPPCQKCASEQFARLEDGDRIPDRVSKTADVEWRCRGCGDIHPKNSPPCDTCGSMQYRSVQRSATTRADAASNATVPNAVTSLRRNARYIIAIVLVVSTIAAVAGAASGTFVLSDPFGSGYRYGAIPATSVDGDGTTTAGEMRSELNQEIEVSTLEWYGKDLRLVYETEGDTGEKYAQELLAIGSVYARYAIDGGEDQRLQIDVQREGQTVATLHIKRTWAIEYIMGDMGRTTYFKTFYETQTLS